MENLTKIILLSGLFFFLGLLSDIGLLNCGDSGLHGQTVIFWTTGYNMNVYILQDNAAPSVTYPPRGTTCTSDNIVYTSTHVVREVLVWHLLTGLVLVTGEVLFQMSAARFLTPDQRPCVAVQETARVPRSHDQLVC